MRQLKTAESGSWLFYLIQRTNGSGSATISKLSFGYNGIFEKTKLALEVKKASKTVLVGPRTASRGLK